MMNNSLKLLVLPIVLFLGMCSVAKDLSVSSNVASLELYSTFEAMGIIVTLGTSTDPDRDAVAIVEYASTAVGRPITKDMNLATLVTLVWWAACFGWSPALLMTYASH